MKLKNAPSVSLETIKRFLQNASLAEGRGDLKEALELLERARGLAPGNPEILLHLGRIHGLLPDFVKAGEFFEKAVHFSIAKTQTLTKAGLMAFEFYDLELSERYLRRATEEKDATADTWIRLARYLENARQVPECMRCLEKAFQLDPASIEIPFVRAQLARQTNNWEEAERLLRYVLSTTDVRLRVQCGYELGAVLDRQGRYDEAMATYVEAKAASQGHAAMFRSTREAYNTKRRQVLTGLSAELLQQWLDTAPQLKPARRLALLCGHPRSGTTLLEQVLDAHPDVVATEETSCFHQNVLVPLSKTQPSDQGLTNWVPRQLKLETLKAAPTQLIRRLREDYFRSMERCLGQPIGGRLLVDKNPILSMLTNGFPRVFPDAKLLIALRDPRDVCLSCFMQFVPSRVGIRRTSHFIFSDLVEQYCEEMNLWRTLAPRMPGRYLEVRYEDMVEDLESVARKTLEFLELPWDPRVLNFHERAEQKLFRLSNYADVSKPIYKRARQRWRNYEKYFEPYHEKLAPFIKAFGYE